MKKPLPSQAYLATKLEYNPETGKLYWLPRYPADFVASATRSVEHICNLWNAKHAGKEAFTAVSSIGYRIGLLDGVSFVAARVIWKLVYGVDPEEIDHINRIKDDNRLVNLRDVTRSLNCRNRGLLRNNTSGVSGVYLERSSGLWVIEVNGKRYGRRKDKAAATKLRASL